MHEDSACEDYAWAFKLLGIGIQPIWNLADESVTSGSGAKTGSHTVGPFTPGTL